MPFVLFSVVVVLYLLHIPWAVWRYHWLERHPEVWHVPPQQRRAVRRASRRLGLAPPRRPLRRRVAGAAARAGGVARRSTGRRLGLPRPRGRRGGRRPDEQRSSER